MAVALLMRSLAAPTSLVTQTGRATPTRGSGLPAAWAAARMVGTMWFSMVPVPVIQVTVPSATVPANFSMRVPRAATRTGGAVAPGTPRGRGVVVVTRSPTLLTASPWRSGMSEARYSSM